MSASYAPLPSEKTMKSLCHGNPDQWLAVQAFSLVTVLGLALFILFSLAAVLAGVLHFIMAGGTWNNGGETLQEWLQATIIYAFATAAALVALAVFIKIYMRSQFGAPTYFSELQADLSQESVLQMCRTYMREHTLDEVLQVEPCQGRLVGLIYESGHSSTFLEVTTVAMNEERTWIVVRGASIVFGKATLVSAFFNDFGASREATNNMMEIFSPHASRQRRPFQGARSSKQALPALEPMDHCPPPLSPKAHQLGWRPSTRHANH